MQLIFASPSFMLFKFGWMSLVWTVIAVGMSWGGTFLVGMKYPKVSERTVRRWFMGVSAVAIALGVAGAYAVSYARFASMKVGPQSLVLSYLGPFGQELRLRPVEVERLTYGYHRRACYIHLQLASGAKHRSVDVRAKTLVECRALHEKVKAALDRETARATAPREWHGQPIRLVCDVVPAPPFEDGPHGLCRSPTP